MVNPLGLGPRDRWFESSLTDQNNMLLRGRAVMRPAVNRRPRKSVGSIPTEAAKNSDDDQNRHVAQ